MSQGRKITKKIFKVAAILLLIFAAIPATAYVLLQSSRVQTVLTGYVMTKISAALQTTFRVERVDIDFLYRARLTGVYLEDMTGDTLLFARQVTAGVRSFNPVSKKISIGSITANEARFNIRIDSAGNLNLRYFLDKLQKKGERSGGGWEVRFDHMKLKNSWFTLDNLPHDSVVQGVNYTNMRLYHLHADLKRFTPSPDSLFFRVRSLSFTEQSGFELKNLRADFSQSTRFLRFRNLTLETDRSKLDAEEISLLFKNWSQFRADSFIHQVRFNIHLNPSEVNMADVGYFAPVFWQNDQSIRLSGQVRGPVDNLKGRNLDVGFGLLSRLKGELNLQGLPEIGETFIHADFRELITSASDLRSFSLPGQNQLNLQGDFDKLGEIRYTGQFTGFIRDFVAYGSFNTALGNISTDLLISPDTSEYVGFRGRLSAIEFNLGSLFNDTTNLGTISLTASVNGASSPRNRLRAELSGTIQQLEFRKYQYSNIRLKGNLQDKIYKGSVQVSDPNIELEFLGTVNLSDSVPVYNFTANVTDANLFALNLTDTDPTFRASFYLIADASGASLDRVNGEVKLLNSLFTRNDKQLQVYNITLEAENTENRNELRFRSDFADARLTGVYNLTTLGESFIRYIRTFLPAVMPEPGKEQHTASNAFQFELRTRQTSELFAFFTPDYYLEDYSNVSCQFDEPAGELNLLIVTRKLEAKGFKLNGLTLQVKGSDSAFHLDGGSSGLVVADRLELENFTLLADASEDTAGIRLRWNNWDDLEKKGDLQATARLVRMPGRNTPNVDIDLYPAKILANDTAWYLSRGMISIDSSRIQLGRILLQHENEFVSVNGAISTSPTDEVEIRFNRFNLGNLNSLSQKAGYKLGGILTGTATISDAYNNIRFISTMGIDSLMLNNEMLGNTSLVSEWDHEKKAVELHAHTMRSNLRTLDIEGEYYPQQSGRIDFGISLEKLRLNLFNPYVNSIFGDLRGIASGKLRLTGTTSKPMLNGEINLQKTAFTVNYLQARYNFSDKVQIQNNNIYFREIRIYDPKGNSAYLSGAIRSRFLKQFELDLGIRSEDFLCMNTTQQDNKLFYGTAYATGSIKINGSPRNITLDVSARTSRNTSIKIPLSNEGELNEYNFISVNVLDTVVRADAETPAYQVDLSGMQINFDLEVTPDAEVQIIFDPKLGDIIRGRGTGNLDMKISTSGNFLMFGDFTIEAGDYLFTMQNFINKKFSIEPGGTITWNGDPFDATIDIVANYKTKASLNDLFGTDEEKYRSKISVEDRLTMTGRIMSPDVQYGIYLPLADEDTRLQVRNAISSSEDLNKQFLSLLIQQRFVLATPGSQPGTSTSGSYSSVAGVNASEFLSNQLSHWLSQISNDVDIGVNYRSNRELKNDEVQVALSTQLFNDRLTINGSVDVATNAQVNTSNNIVGEFDIDYKITKNGKLRVKTYNHINNDMLYENSSPYTQGFGVFYKEEFNTLGELLRRYWQSVAGMREDQPELPPDRETPVSGL